MTKNERAAMLKFRRDNPSVPVLRNLDRRILARVTDKRGRANGKLDMSLWHAPCGTAHCIAGWAVTLAGKKAEKLADRCGTWTAADWIFMASTGEVPDFFADDKEALVDLRKRARKSLRVTR